LDPLLADLFASTYYFMEWRFFTPVSAVLLNQNGMLPDDADLEEVRVGVVVCQQNVVDTVQLFMVP
jgi:hypothetical protein